VLSNRSLDPWLNLFPCPGSRTAEGRALEKQSRVAHRRGSGYWRSDRRQLRISASQADHQRYSGDKVEKVAAHWREKGADVVAIKADVSHQQDLHAMARLAVERHGRIDVLVNCAGVNVFRDPLQMTEEDWRRCFAIDLDGAWFGCKAVLPQMIEQGIGSIINIASTHSSHIIPGCFPYPVAKHGLLGLTRALGIEYAPKGIRVNAIAPGYIETQLNVDYWNGFADPHAERQRAFDLHPPNESVSR
jgi:NAD(P)-dependent dehydrogenase (short-subunit alcohol dehydrogenase family)